MEEGFDSPWGRQETRRLDMGVTSDTLPEGVLRRYPNGTFFETGTYRGGGVALAKRVGFGRIISVDSTDAFLDPEVRLLAPEAELHWGDSRNLFRTVLCGVEGPATFWLDSHATHGGQSGASVVEELQAVLSLWRRGNVVMVDDMDLMRNGTWGQDVRWQFLSALVPFLAMGCSVSYEDSLCKPRDIMVVRDA